MRYITYILVVLMGGSAVAWDSKTYKKPSPEELKKILDPETYDVTQQCGTERPFANKYWDHHEEGIYVDVVSGEPLFSSKDKYDSGSGWPSFTQPIEKKNVVTKTDKSHFMTRVEIRSKHGDSHLGHVFDDGPGPTGERYCTNSASLRFIASADLEKEGYGEYKKLFAKPAPLPTPGSSKGDSKMTETKKSEIATIAAGCFWGVEHIMRRQKGVLKTTVGYIGGNENEAKYEVVKRGMTEHAEAVQIEYDPSLISYKEILGLFWRLHDPTTKDRQKGDVGRQYRSAIFYHNDEQKKIAEESQKAFDASGVFSVKSVTEIVKAGPFYEAEDYHQDYLKKNPDGYNCHILRDK